MNPVPPAAVLQTRAAAGPVRAALGFLRPTDLRLYHHLYRPPGGLPRHNFASEQRLCDIRDARRLQPGPSIEVEGFELVRGCSPPPDCRDAVALLLDYYPACEGLLRRRLGACRAIVFEHRLWQWGLARGLAAADGGEVTLAALARCDCSETSGRRRLHLVLPQEAASLARRRHAIVKLWRPLGGQGLDAPLALCDAGSLQRDALVSCDIYSPRRTEQILLLTWSAGQRWFHCPQMQPDEALIFKCFDSASDGRARFTPHAVFDHPRAPADVPPCPSLEVSCLLLFD